MPKREKPKYTGTGPGLKENGDIDWGSKEVSEMISAMTEADRKRGPYVPKGMEGKNREGMILGNFLYQLAIGSTATRMSWPKEKRGPGIHMGLEDNKLYIGDELWVPTQEDLLADDWSVGD